MIYVVEVTEDSVSETVSIQEEDEVDASATVVQQSVVEETVTMDKVNEAVVTGVFTETKGGTVAVVLSPKELSTKQREEIRKCRRLPIKHLTRRVNVDMELRLAQLERDILHRSEKYLYINGLVKTGEAPRFKRALTAMSIDLGQPIRLECEVEGQPRPSIKWYKNEIEITDRRYVIDFSETLTTLTIDTSVIDDNATFTVIAFNDFGECTTSADITIILESPTFTRPLTDHTVTLSETTTLECTFTGKPIPEPKWFISGVDVWESEKYHVETRETTTSLTIAEITLDETEMEYLCKATNPAGVATTTAKLFPQEPPKITKGPENFSVPHNESINISCVFTGIPQPTVTWYKTEETIVPGDRYRVETTMNTVTLTIPKSEVEDSAEYTLKLENPAGSDTFKVTVTVLEPVATGYPPEFIITIKPSKVKEGDSADFSCQVIGEPTPELTWFYNKQPLEGTGHYAFVQDREIQILQVFDVAPVDAGEYTVTAKNPFGEVSCSANLDVKQIPKESPHFIVAINTQEIEEGENARFYCQAAGIPIPELLWYRSGKQIQPDNRFVIRYNAWDTCSDSTLVVVDVQSEVEGVYHAVANNEWGKALCEGELFAKSTDVPPEFTEVYPETNVEVKKNLVLKTRVIGKPEPTVKWLRDDTELQQTFKVKMSKQKDLCTLTISGITQKMSGVYKCVAKNTAGEAVHQSQVNVNEKMEPPVFTQKPLNKDIKEGGKTKFDAVVKGKPLPEITWIMNDEPLVPTDRITTEQKEVRGDLALTLTFDQATPEDICNLKITAKNPAGEDTCTAKLNVQIKKEKPKFLKKPQDQEVPEEEDVCFETEVIAKPEPQVEWFKGDTKLEPSDRVIYLQEGNKHTITIRSVRKVEAGVYNVKATNIAGTMGASAKLKVIEKPKTPEPVVEEVVESVSQAPEQSKPTTEPPAFVEVYEDTSIEEKSNLQLKVKVTGIPEPEIKWMKDGKELTSTLKMKVVTKDDTSTFSINNIMQRMAGKYKCIAKNSAGKAQHVATVTVTDRLEPPEFVRPLTDKETREGQRVRFDATVTGLPVPDVTWFLKDTPLENSPDVKIETQESRVRGEFSHTLYLENCTKDIIGEVKAIAKNKAGEATSTANLVISVKKEMPKFLKKPEPVECMEHDDVTYTTTVSGKPEPTIEWYRGDTKLEPSERIIYEQADNVHTLVIKNVHKDEEGMVTVKAINEMGDMSASARLRVTAVQPPKILKPTKDTIAPEQGTAKFSAKITGFPAPSVIWYLEDVELPESEHIIYEYSKKDNMYHLTLSGDLKGMTGKIKVIAKNNGGQASCESQLTIKGRAPTFIEKPLKCTVLESGTCVFRCRVDGEPAPSVEWSKGKWRKIVNNKVTRLYLDEETNQHVMEMDNVKEKDAGTYTVTITNEYGTDSCPATLMVTTSEEEFKFTKDLEDISVIENEFAVFECEVTKKNIPVDWFYKDKPVVLGPKFQVLTEDTVHKLSINMAKPEDEGAVKAVFRKAVTTAKLSVQPTVEPHFTHGLEDLCVKTSEDAEFVVWVEPADAKVAWFLDNVELFESDKYRMRSEDDMRVLEIVNIQPSDDGQISALVGNNTSYAELTIEDSDTEVVQDRLIFEMRQERHMKVIGEFLCSRGGSHVMEISSSDSEKKFMRPVEKPNQRRWIVRKVYLDNVGVTKIDKWAVKSYTDYICSAEAINDVSRGFMDNVTFAKQSVEFILELTRANLVVSWMKDGFPIHRSDKYKMDFEEEGLFHTLTVDDVTETDEGVYTFKVNHRRSSISQSLSGISFENFLIETAIQQSSDNVFY